MSRFFINRPIVAIVIAIITVTLGLIMLTTLPVAQFPKIAPPEIRLGATFVGADAQTLEQAVATPIEQQVSGVDHMTYMYSVSATANQQSSALPSQTLSTRSRLKTLSTQPVRLEVSRRRRTSNSPMPCWLKAV